MISYIDLEQLINLNEIVIKVINMKSNRKISIQQGVN